MAAFSMAKSRNADIVSSKASAWYLDIHERRFFVGMWERELLPLCEKDLRCVLRCSNPFESEDLELCSDDNGRDSECCECTPLLWGKRTDFARCKLGRLRGGCVSSFSVLPLPLVAELAVPLLPKLLLNVASFHMFGIEEYNISKLSTASGCRNLDGESGELGLKGKPTSSNNEKELLKELLKELFVGRMSIKSAE